MKTTLKNAKANLQDGPWSRWAQAVLCTIKVAMDKSLFFWVSCDEVRIIDNQSWLSMLEFVIDEWKHVPILFNLQWVDGAMSSKLMEMIVASFVSYGGVSETNLSLEVHSFWSLWNHDLLGFKNWSDDLVHAKTCSPFQRCALHNKPCKSSDYHFEFQRLLCKFKTFNFPC